VIECSARTGEGSRRRGWLSGCRRGRPPRLTVAAAGALDALLRERTEANGAFFEPRPRTWRGCCHRMAERFARGGAAVALGSPGGALRRPPRRGRVRPPGDRRQASAARDRPRREAVPAMQADLIAEPTTSRSPSADEPMRPRRRGAGPAGARLPDDRLRAVRRRVGVRAARETRSSARSWRDALPRALGAGPRLLRAPRPARGPEAGRSMTRARRASSIRSSPRARPTSRRDRGRPLAVVMQGEEVGALREQDAQRAARTARGRGGLRSTFDAAAGSRFGNGGSATDSMDSWPTLRARPRAGRRAPPRPDRGPAILTAIANDIGRRRSSAPGDRLRRAGDARSRSPPAATPST
jgi:hypothetical protein